MLENKLRNEIAPPEMGMSGDIYGLQFGSTLEDKSLRKIIVCLDPVKKVIMEAIKQESHLIISHHGLIHRKTKYFNEDILDRLKLLGSNNINLFVMHTAWDAAPGGISETYLKQASLEMEGNFYFKDKHQAKAIGRVARPLVENTTIEGIGKNLKKNLNLDHIRILGPKTHAPKKIAVVGGKGFTQDTILRAKREGCDTILTGELNHPEYLLARELGMQAIETTHYSSENPGMQNLTLLLATTFPRDEFLFVKSGEPITFI